VTRLDNPKFVFIVFMVTVLVIGSLIVYSVFSTGPIMIPLTYKLPGFVVDTLPKELKSVSAVIIPAEELTLEVNEFPMITTKTTPEIVRDSMVLIYRTLAEGIGNRSIKQIIVYVIEYPWGATVLLIMRALRYVPFGLEINLNIH